MITYKWPAGRHETHGCKNAKAPWGNTRVILSHEAKKFVPRRVGTPGGERTLVKRQAASLPELEVALRPRHDKPMPPSPCSTHPP